MSIKRNLALNGSAVLLHKGVLAVQHLVLVPFFLTSWGTATYGEWLTLSAIPAGLAFCNLGLGTAAANTFVLRYLNGDTAGAARAMRAGQVLLVMVMLLGVVVTVPILWTLLATGTLQRMSVHAPAALAVVALLAASSLVTFYNQLNDGWFRAAGKAHLAIGWEAGFALAQIGVFVGLLMAGKDMLWLASADLMLTSIAAIGLYVVGKGLLPNVQPAAHALDRADVALFFRKGLAFLMEPIRRAIYLEGTIVVTRIGLGPEAVAIFVTLRTLANSVAQLYNSVQASIFPELQRAIAENNYPTARRIFHLGMGATLALTLAGLTGLGLSGPWIYAKWTAHMLHPPDHAWLLLLAGIAANAAWWPAASTFRAVNQPERYAVAGVISALVGVALTAALVGPMGINGALSGLLVMEILMAIYVLPASCRLLGQPLRQLPADILSLRHDALGLLRRGLLLAKAGQPFR